MPRIKPDLTIKVRLKNNRKNTTIQIIKEKNGNIRTKINNAWFKNGIIFPAKKFEKIFYNTIKSIIE